MTFTEIVADVMDRLNLTSSDATTRIGKFVNARYRRLTSSVGLQTSRRTTVSADTTEGVQTLSFGLEKIHAVYIPQAGGGRSILAEKTFDQIRHMTTGTGTPSAYAIDRQSADEVRILLDVLPQEVITLYADGMENLSTLSGATEPSFPASYHDILVYGAMADELNKMEKHALARDAEVQYERLLSDLRLYLAKSAYLKNKQNSYGASARIGAAGAAGSGSDLPNGAASYTQSGLVTFDRSPDAPFAVTPGSAAVANLVAAYAQGADDANTLEGEAAADFHNASNLDSGTVPLARITGLTNAQLDVAAAIDWTKISKAGSSLADLITRSAADLDSGTLLDARLSANVPLIDAANVFTANQRVNAGLGVNVAPGATGTISASGALYERSRSVALGEWTDIAYSAGNFTVAAGGGTWTVSEADQNLLRYTLIGKTACVAFALATTTTSGATSTILSVTLPAALTANKTTRMPYALHMGGVGAQMGTSEVLSGFAVLRFYRDTNATAFPASTDSLYMWGVMTFEVQ